MKKVTRRNARLDRRDFMKGTVAGMGVAAASGSAPFFAQSAQASIESVGSPQGIVPDISPAQIKETVSADVVVVGAGISGASAALSAIEAGAKTILLEKGETYTARGNDNGCVNSSVHKEAGVVINREALISELMIQANYRVYQKLLTVWVDHSGEAIDWLRSKVEPEGVKAALDPSEGASDEDKEGPYKAWRTAVAFGSPGSLEKLPPVITSDSTQEKESS
jgi:fumarate reductase flavoprotein subunit